MVSRRKQIQIVSLSELQRATAHSEAAQRAFERYHRLVKEGCTCPEIRYSEFNGYTVRDPLAPPIR